MTAPQADSALDVRERRLGRAAAVVPYVLLAAATALSWASDERPLGHRLRTLAIAALAAAWMLWMVTLHPGWTRRRGLMAAFYVGLMAFVAVLVVRNPWFGLFAVTGYLYAWELLAGRWRLVGVTAAAVLHATGIFGGRLPTSPAAIVAFVLLVAVIVALTALFSSLGEVVSEQNQQRKRMVAELAEANRRLEAAMAENEGLHAQLLAQARGAGVLDERQRMAREIHDTIAQGLTGIVTQVQAAQNAAERPADWRRHLDNAARLARESLSEARRSVQAVGPEPLTTAPARGARRGGDALVRAARRGGRGRHHRHRQAHAPRGRGGAAAHRPGGAGQRGQARRRLQGGADPVLHGGPGDAGHPRRRRRLRPGHDLDRGAGRARPLRPRRHA
jgi:hypothetical protein